LEPYEVKLKSMVQLLPKTINISADKEGALSFFFHMKELQYHAKPSRPEITILLVFFSANKTVSLTHNKQCA
jgi:hypothetical protein